ncbi:hypothetical protein M2375_000895 [Comamonas sp. BIGb0152]|uniref:hypothetical protein n=1 Tax=Comamonas sp. BIGb0152 TaxID=2940601 RepID=UPI00216A88F9|nr:hypothetical protein [Comamonas sp. BIGb0152]MCS4292689.1 hypothetical protein [Comamonas sp. BIGb0152]
MNISKNTGEHLRQMLFKQLEALTDPDKDIDLKRAEIANNTAQAIINSAKVEVDYVKAIDGAITLPYVEGQNGVTERPYRPAVPTAEPAPQFAEPEPRTPEEREQALLNSGPRPGHPWHGLGSRKHLIKG